MPSLAEVTNPRAGIDSVDRLGRYDLIAVLARGGMGDVYLAVAQGPVGFNKLLVVKELRHDALDDDRLLAMFLDEARLTARLNHPNIVQTFEVGHDGRRRFLAMEYLEGQSLHRLLHRARKRGTPLPTAIHFHVLCEVLTALEYSHSLTEFDGTPLGIVHRDVSPQNVLITYEGNVKLIDFGIAKTSLPLEQTNSGLLKGKLKYMAPEQALGRPVDRRADVFAAGMMLWEATAGAGPWEGVTELAILRSLMALEVPRLSELHAELDPDLTAIVDRATHPDRDARYPTALALRDDLEHYVTVHGLSLGRELPAFVSRLFGEDRRKLRALIDAQLRILRTPSPIEILTLSGLHQTTTSSRPVIADALRERTPSDALAPPTHSAPPDSASPVMVSQWKLRTGTAPSAPSDGRRPAIGSRSNLRGAAAGLAFGAALACAVLFVRSPGAWRPAPAGAAPSAERLTPTTIAAPAPVVPPSDADPLHFERPSQRAATSSDPGSEPGTPVRAATDPQGVASVPGNGAARGPSSLSTGRPSLRQPPRGVTTDAHPAAGHDLRKTATESAPRPAPRDVDRENPYLP